MCCPSTVPAAALCGGGCVSLCRESRWTVHPLRCYHVYYLQECDMSVPRGMGTKRGVMSSPPGPPISSSGRHLPHLQPTAAWRSLSLRTLGERERGGAADLSQAGPRGRSQPAVATSAAPACCLTFGQWEVWNGCLVGCDVLCVYVSAYVSVPQMYACHLVD